METLTDLRAQLQEAGVELYLSGVTGSVMDQFAGTDILEQLGWDRISRTVQESFEKLRRDPNLIQTNLKDQEVGFGQLVEFKALCVK